jgi:tRNA dimethylallyltransferase
LEGKIIVIVGPTASGKTDLAVKVAESVKGEIISADSRQVYKHLNIGTAKPSKREMKNIKHYFVDKVNPDEGFDVSRFETEALKIIEKNLKAGVETIVAGGSGLYIKALIDGIFDVDSDIEYRNHLLALKEKFGNDFLHAKLKEVDPVSASRMLPQNWKRIIRALEVHHLTGKPIGELHKEQAIKHDFRFIQYGLMWDRKILYNRIEHRVDTMIQEGLVSEVTSILNKGYDKNLNSLNTVGYKEIISYIEGEITLDRSIDLIKRNTRRYAKRQLTWFRADSRINWLEVDENSDFNKLAVKIIEKEGLNERKN